MTWDGVAPEGSSNFCPPIIRERISGEVCYNCGQPILGMGTRLDIFNKPSFRHLVGQCPCELGRGGSEIASKS
jgi:hypothetical protein